jgi:hypothetical protein
MEELKTKLKDVSFVYIRENWLDYKDIIINTPYYELLWNCLERKNKIDKNDVFFYILKKFINNQEIINNDALSNGFIVEEINEQTLIFKSLSNNERKHIHLLCDKIGLHHESKTEYDNCRFLYIYKPKIWLWEFTEKNPYAPKFISY